MTFYFTGVLVALVLCAILHWIEIREGVEKDVEGEAIVTALVCAFSWVGVLICLGGLVHYYFTGRD